MRNLLPEFRRFFAFGGLITVAPRDRVFLQSIHVAETDPPGESFRPVILAGSFLSNITRSNTFVTWLIAENDATRERVFLRWVEWGIDWNVNFNVSNGDVSALATKYVFRKIAEGAGQGPISPTMIPFDVTEQ